MSLTLDSVVNVTVNIAPQSAQAQGFGKALILGQSTVLPLSSAREGVHEDHGRRTRLRVEHRGVQGGRDLLQPAAEAASVKIGRRFLTAQAGQLRGGGASSTVADYTGISTGAFNISINGTVRNITAVDFSAATTMANVATAIQTRLAAALASTTCTWDGTRFIITSPTTGITSIVLFATTPGSGVDISGLLFLTFALGARSVSGIALETQTAALNASAIFDSDFYGITNTSAAVLQDQKDTAAWAQSVRRAFWYTISDPNAYDASDSSDLFSFLQALDYDYAFGSYSTTEPYAAVSAMARALVVNLDLPNSAITLDLKTLPGVAPDDLTQPQVDAIHGKNGNSYVNIGSSPALQEGRVANGRFFDEVMGLDWLEARLKEAVFGKLYGTATKIPQTDAGMVVLTQACEAVCAKAQANGLAGAGVWNGDDIGELKNGDTLEKGYYVHAETIASLSQADKENRLAAPITVCIIGAGAIHNVNVTVNFQR
jgi:hypothetical protein